MFIADSKEFQSCVNLFYERVSNKVFEANRVADRIWQAFSDNDLMGKLTAGEQTALQNFVDNLSTLASSPVIVRMSRAYAETHSDNDVQISGVNV